MLDIIDYNYSLVVVFSWKAYPDIVMCRLGPASVFLLFLPHSFAQSQQATPFEFGL